MEAELIIIRYVWNVIYVCMYRQVSARVMPLWMYESESLCEIDPFSKWFINNLTAFMLYYGLRNA